MPESVRRTMRPVSRIFTVLPRRTRNLISRTQGSLTSRNQMEQPRFIQTARSQEEMETWLTTLQREDSSRSEDFLRQVEEALRSLGIQSGQQSSTNPHPSPNSSPEYNEINHSSGQLSSETWNTQQMPNGQTLFLCIHPDSQISLMSQTPLGNGLNRTYSA
nr:C3 protein [Trifolium virus 1]QVS02801.1 C3 [Trifolium virus 1]